MNRTLMTAIVECAAFLELSDDGIGNPDAAVAQLETLATILSRLAASERAEFARFVEELAQGAQTRQGQSERVSFL